jgi:ATP-binding cassette subfamily F protein 3
MLSRANVPLLDEPTNHLDIAAKEAVETALAVFPGTILAVSHDRYFLDKIADRVVELDNGALSEYPGNYSDYRARKQYLARLRADAAAAAAKAADKAADKPAAAPSPRKRKAGDDKAVKKLENDIAALEAALAEYEPSSTTRPPTRPRNLPPGRRTLRRRQRRTRRKIRQG